uniref:Uncharacterized protein n=1 Tax=Rhizophora mucronata TaxID=61149 RepID=A0A2P2P9B3_RHIMU
MKKTVIVQSDQPTDAC